jgi:hypothetical protein
VEDLENFALAESFFELYGTLFHLCHISNIKGIYLFDKGEIHEIAPFLNKYFIIFYFGAVE